MKLKGARIFCHKDGTICVYPSQSLLVYQNGYRPNHGMPIADDGLSCECIIRSECIIRKALNPELGLDKRDSE